MARALDHVKPRRFDLVLQFILGKKCHELFPEAPLTKFPVWLVTHRELRTSRRIRLVYEILADELVRIEDFS